jgi:hypothetical protein
MLNILPSSLLIAVGVFVDALYQVEGVPSSSDFLRVLYV